MRLSADCTVSNGVSRAMTVYCTVPHIVTFYTGTYVAILVHVLTCTLAGVHTIVGKPAVLT